MQQRILCLALIALLASFGVAQDKKNDKSPEFFLKQIVRHTPVKNQGHSGTCWSFGTTSFFESELLRLGRGEFDLSEMFVVRHVYSQKIANYIRYHGTTGFGEGSLPSDWIETVKKHGIVLENCKYPRNPKNAKAPGFNNLDSWFSNFGSWQGATRAHSLSSACTRARSMRAQCITKERRSQGAKGQTKWVSY